MSTLAAKTKAVEEAKLKRDKILAADMRKVFGSAEGQNVLRWMMVECGYQSQSVVADKQTQEIYVDSTIYNEARRNLYLQIRQYLTPKVLLSVELQPPASSKKPITKKEKQHGRRSSS
jgi:hypothetical protein